MQDARSKYAIAKIQKINDEAFIIRSTPTFLTTKYQKQNIAHTYGVEPLAISNNRKAGLIGVIYYDPDSDKLMIVSTTDNLFLNGFALTNVGEEALRLAGKGLESKPGFFLRFKDQSRPLNDLSQLYLLKTPMGYDASNSMPEVFCFVLPNKNFIKYETKKNTSSAQMAVAQQPVAKLVDKSIYNRWTADDREQLKKLILQYGYGRWKQLQRSSSLIGGKLETKNNSEIKAFANSFIRALALSLPQEQAELKLFMTNLIQQTPEDIFIQPNQKDWDQQIPLSQRSVQYSKRIQLLSRVRSLVRKFKQEQLRTIPDRDRTKINWDGLLNFISLTQLYGQRPAVWWVKKHDIDLILGVHKYGYANYSAIKAAREYCFLDLEKSNTYGEFPSADNLTRRLKKLMQTVSKIQQTGNIDFDVDGQSEEEEKIWTEQQKRALFKLLTQYGVSLTVDGRSNWMDIRQRLKESYSKQFDKTLGQVEKMVSRLRLGCQEMLSAETLKSKDDMPDQTEQIPAEMVDETPEKQQQQNPNKFIITQQMASRFNKNTNMLSFVRKSLLSNDAELFNSYVDELKQKHQELGPGQPGYIEEQHDQYDCAVNDLALLQWVAKQGLVSCATVPALNTPEKVTQRVQWICDACKTFKDKLNDKKKKMKVWEEPKKRTKFELSKDKFGNIIFPITINPSLKLHAVGRVCTLPNYHSECNLFPIGFISTRTHASMFNKNQRCNYLCEILQGDGKPIYRVTSEEDPTHPIVKDSSTGCWVYICNKVNQLQDVKKEKVTISGTQRFGLLETNVVRLLEDLPDAEKCTKYKFKLKNLQGEAQK